MGTSAIHICDSCGDDHVGQRMPSGWVDMHIKGGQLDGQTPMLCDQCMGRVVSHGPMRTILERHRAEKERGMAKRP